VAREAAARAAKEAQEAVAKASVAVEVAAAAERDVLDVPPLEVEPPPPSPPSTSTRRYAILKKHYNLCN